MEIRKIIAGVGIAAALIAAPRVSAATDMGLDEIAKGMNYPVSQSALSVAPCSGTDAAATEWKFKYVDSSNGKEWSSSARVGDDRMLEVRRSDGSRLNLVVTEIEVAYQNATDKKDNSYLLTQFGSKVYLVDDARKKGTLLFDLAAKEGDAYPGLTDGNEVSRVDYVMWDDILMKRMTVGSGESSVQWLSGIGASRFQSPMNPAAEIVVTDVKIPGGDFVGVGEIAPEPFVSENKYLPDGLEEYVAFIVGMDEAPYPDGSCSRKISGAVEHNHVTCKKVDTDFGFMFKDGYTYEADKDGIVYRELEGYYRLVPVVDLNIEVGQFAFGDADSEIVEIDKVKADGVDYTRYCQKGFGSSTSLNRFILQTGAVEGNFHTLTPSMGEMPSSGYPRVVKVVLPGGTTLSREQLLQKSTGAVEGVAADVNADADAPLYDLQGRRVESPSTGTIVIRSGAKQIVH